MKIVLTIFAKSSNGDAKQSNRINQSGFSLIEVMVAALILSTAILGVASLIMVGMKGTQQSFMKSQAIDIVHNLTERMRSNYAGVIDDKYVFDSTAVNCGDVVPNCSTADCTHTQIATADKLNLVCGYKIGINPRTGGIKKISATDNVYLVNGSLEVSCVNCATGDVRITVGWDERVFAKDETPVRDLLSIDTRIAAP